MELFKTQLKLFKEKLNSFSDDMQKADMVSIIEEYFGYGFCNIACIKEHSDIFQAILDAVPVPVYYKNTEGVYLACNNALCEIYGLNREDVIGKTAYSFFSRHVADSFAESDRVLIKDCSQEKVEHRGQFPGRDDSFHIIQKRAFVKDGRVQGIIGVIMDMTELKMVEDRAWASEAFFKSLFETSPLPIVLINSFNIITDLNSTAEAFFDAPGGLAGQEVSNLFCRHGDFDRAMKAQNGMAKVMINNKHGMAQEVISMRSASELNGETYYALAFMRMDL